MSDTSEDIAFMKTLKKEFLDSIPSELDGWNEALLEFEKSEDQEQIRILKQNIHSVKGSVQTVDLKEASQILHLLETWINEHCTKPTNTPKQISEKIPKNIKEKITALLKVTDALKYYFQTLNDPSVNIYDNPKEAQRIVALLGFSASDLQKPNKGHGGSGAFML